MVLDTRMMGGCKSISKTALIPNHQNILLSYNEKPMITHQAINVATLNAMVNA